MNATILAIGDELLVGQVVNTNAGWLAGQLTLLGIRVRRVVTVGDHEHDIIDAMEQEWIHSDLLLTSGGLGTTGDDVTREAVAEFFGRKLLLNTSVLARLQESIMERGQTPMAALERMAMMPRDFAALPNPVGQAPGLHYRTARRRRTFVALPGPPEEMKAIFKGSVVARLSVRRDRFRLSHRTLCTAGIPESFLASKLADLTARFEIAFLPSPGQVRLRLTALGKTAEASLDALEKAIRSVLGDAVFGTGEDTLELVVGNLLRQQQRTIAVAESCTGGLVQDLLTNVPGSSDYVAGGVVAYDNRVKRMLLGVQAATLTREGAVSRTTALEMARGVQTAIGADLGLAVTGVAGPGGGTKDKPVGTVWIGLVDGDQAEARLLTLGQDRRRNKQQSAVLALDMARRRLLRH